MAAMAGPLIIRVDEKAFPPVGDRPRLRVLRDIELSIAPGSFVVLTGPSGCGKSTLLNIVAGLDSDYSGSVEFGLAEPRLSYMFQTPRLLPWRTVEENVRLVLPDGDPRLDEVSGMLQAVGLADAASAYPERLSLGMQRRAALARAFIVAPDILLMDEPFVSLDDPTAQSLREILMALWQRRPTTVLFVTHDRQESVMLGTRLVRVGGQPATIVQDEPISLTADARRDREAVTAERRRLFQDA